MTDIAVTIREEIQRRGPRHELCLNVEQSQAALDEIERLRQLLREEMKAAKNSEWNAFMAGLGPSRWEG